MTMINTLKDTDCQGGLKENNIILNEWLLSKTGVKCHFLKLSIHLTAWSIFAYLEPN